MITAVKVANDQGDLLTLPMDDASGGYAVEDIDGLDPVKATLVSSPFALLDGSQFQASRRDSRNIVITLSLEPDYVSGTLNDLRKELLQYFMTERRVYLTFTQSDGPDLTIQGRVESFDAPRFNPEVKATISIMCFSPDFVDPTEQEFEGNTTSGTTDSTIEYDGTIETGVIFTLNVNRTLSAFTITNRSEDNSIQTMEFEGDLVDGDTVIISSVVGNKGVWLVHGADAPISILYCVSPTSNWVQLFPGDNAFRVQATGAAIPYTVEYTDKYGGL